MVDTNSLQFVLYLVSIPCFITGLIGNASVIRIVHKTREMHTTTNFLLANLAVSDVISILQLPLFISAVYKVEDLNDGFGKLACKFSALTVIPILASSFTLTVLAVERYHALLKPFRTGLRLNKNNIKKAIALIWILSLLLSLPSFFLYEWNETYSECTFVPTQARKVFVIIGSVFSTYITMAVFLYCYGSLINGLYFTDTICATDTEEDRRSEKKKLVVTFILVTAGFIIGYGPTVVFHSVIFLRGNEPTILKDLKDSELSVAFYFLFYCSLCLNPILYAFRSTNFQKGFKRIIFCRKPPT